MRTVRLDAVDSTMLEARRLIVAGEPLPFVVVAAEQTGGIGRLARKWCSPRGGLWFTLAAVSPGLDPLLSLRTALEVHDACARTLACKAQTSSVAPHASHTLHVKWPNDVVHGAGVSPSKIAGVLIERLPTAGAPAGGATVLCGVGINVNNTFETLPPDVAARATSLCELRGSALSSAEFDATLGSLAGGLERTITRPDRADQGEALRSLAAHLWKPDGEVPITLPDGTRTSGRIDGLSDQGQLLATIGGERRVLNSVDSIG